MTHPTILSFHRYFPEFPQEILDLNRCDFKFKAPNGVQLEGDLYRVIRKVPILGSAYVDLKPVAWVVATVFSNGVIHWRIRSNNGEWIKRAPPGFIERKRSAEEEERIIREAFVKTFPGYDPDDFMKPGIIPTFLYEYKGLRYYSYQYRTLLIKDKDRKFVRWEPFDEIEHYYILSQKHLANEANKDALKDHFEAQYPEESSENLIFVQNLDVDSISFINNLGVYLAYSVFSITRDQKGQEDRMEKEDQKDYYLLTSGVNFRGDVISYDWKPFTKSLELQIRLKYIHMNRNRLKKARLDAETALSLAEKLERKIETEQKQFFTEDLVFDQISNE